MSTQHEPRPVLQHGSDDPEADGPDSLGQRVLALRLPQDHAARPSRANLVAWALVLLLATSTAVLGYLAFGRKPPEPGPALPEKTPGTSQAGQAPAGNIALDSKGYIIPVHEILVSPKVSGMILKSYILEGRRVTKGEVLAELEDVDYKADRDRAKSAVEGARERLSELETSRPNEVGQAAAEMREAKAQRVQLKADYDRARQLYREQKAISTLEYDLAESKYMAIEERVKALEHALGLMESSRARRIAAAQADLAAAQADLAKAEWRLDNCTIRAPVSGTILKKNAEEGNVVNPIAMQGSFSLCNLADLSDLEVELTIQERDIAKVSTGQKCKVRAEAFPTRVYEGVVSRLMPIADRGKGAVPVRVKIDIPREEEGIYLKPEMGAIVSFLADGKAHRVKPQHC